MIVMITGVMAAGKSTIGQAVAERYEKSVHLRGDAFRRMIVNGRIDMGAASEQAALDQLMLRYKAAARTADLYSKAGFVVVYQDTIIGPVLNDVIAMYDGLPLKVVVLHPRAEVVGKREKAREKIGYTRFSVEQLQNVMDETPRLGFWLDNSDLSVAETVDAIVDYLSQ